MLKDAPEEIIKIEECKSRTQSLRTRFAEDFAKFRLDKYSIPKEEGEWENYTTNRPATDASKLINILAYSNPRIYIPITDETEKERKSLSLTERFIYGAISLRDSTCQTIPEVLPLQEAMAWNAAVRGWLGLRLFVYEDGGEVIPDIAVWDLYNTYWISGSRGLLWAAYHRFANVDDLKNTYGSDLDANPDKDGKASVYDVWDTEEEGVIVNNKFVKKDTHDLKRVPVLLLPVGAMPLVQADKDDTIKDLGMSFAVNNRSIYETESKVSSYYLTLLAKAAKTPLVITYDSNKDPRPPSIEGSPYKAGAILPIDVGKGQSVSELVKPEMTRDGYAFLQQIRQQLDMGGVAPIAYGLAPYPSTAAGTNLLVHQSLTNIQPFVKAMERGFVWIAHEFVSQYKSGRFKKMTLRGIDGSSRRFEVEVSHKNIDDKWQFECELITKQPQDLVANMGVSVQGIEAGIISRETAREIIKIVDDPDLEQTKIDREKVYDIAAIKLRKTAADLDELGDKEAAQYILDYIEQSQQEAPKGIPSATRPRVAAQPGITTPVRPSGTTTAQVPTAPETGRPSALKRFLSRLGV